MKKQKRWAAIPSLLLAFTVHAEQSGSTVQDVYGEASLGHLRMDVGDAEFDAVALGFRAGAYLKPQVGLELFLSTGVTDDESRNTDGSLNYSAQVMLRLESPESEQEKVFLLLGYGVSDISVERLDNGEETSETLSGFSFGGGAEYRMSESSPHLLNLSWQRNFENDGVKYDYTSLGYRFEF